MLTQFYDSHLRPAGTEAPQFALLMTLEKRGCCNQAALVERYALDKTTVSRNLRLLERNGWIQSSIGNDRRERVFSLTAAGRKRLAIGKPGWKKAQSQLRAGMTDEQWDEMFRVFQTIAKSVASTRTL
jgi:DNA-binding MarR family transcriptional regulator